MPFAEAETAGEFRLRVAELRRQNFDGDITPQFVLAPAIDRAHPAGADQFDDRDGREVGV